MADPVVPGAEERPIMPDSSLYELEVESQVPCANPDSLPVSGAVIGRNPSRTSGSSTSAAVRVSAPPHSRTAPTGSSGSTTRQRWKRRCTWT